MKGLLYKNDTLGEKNNKTKSLFVLRTYPISFISVCIYIFIQRTHNSSFLNFSLTKKDKRIFCFHGYICDFMYNNKQNIVCSNYY